MSAGMAGFLQAIMIVGGSGVIIAQLARFFWRITKLSEARDSETRQPPPAPSMPQPPYQVQSVTYEPIIAFCMDYVTVAVFWGFLAGAACATRYLVVMCVFLVLAGFTIITEGGNPSYSNLWFLGVGIAVSRFAMKTWDRIKSIVKR